MLALFTRLGVNKSKPRYRGEIVAAARMCQASSNGQYLLGMNMKKLITAAFLMALACISYGQQWRVDRNVVIGMVSGLALTMDVHYPESPNGYGIVFIAGSGFTRSLSYDARPLTESFQRYGTPILDAGYTVFALNHRATPRFKYPDPVLDVQRAVRFIRFNAKQYGISADAIGATGHSSGGQLAALLGVLDGAGDNEDPDPVNKVSAKVQSVVLRAPNIEIATINTETSTPLITLFMNTRPNQKLSIEETRRFKEAIPTTHVTEDDAPTLLLHGSADDIVPQGHSESFYAALVKAGVNSRLLIIEGGGHSADFRGAINPPDINKEINSWFDSTLRN